MAEYCFGCKFKAPCESRGDEVGATYGIWGGEKRSRS